MNYVEDATLRCFISQVISSSEISFVSVFDRISSNYFVKINQTSRRRLFLFDIIKYSHAHPAQVCAFNDDNC